MNSASKTGSIIPKLMERARYNGGLRIRTITCDGLMFDGILTYFNGSKAEVQNGNYFYSFNRSWTKLVIIKESEESL